MSSTFYTSNVCKTCREKVDNNYTCKITVLKKRHRRRSTKKLLLIHSIAKSLRAPILKNICERKKDCP